MNQYEKLIEYIINEQEDKARELFHQLVVEKSREIYENLIDEVEVDETIDGVDSLVDEVDAEQEGVIEADDEMPDDVEMGMDADDADDAEMDMDTDDTDDGEMDMDAEMGDDEGGLEDRVMDLESALDELKAEFDALMADEANEPEHADMDLPKEEGIDPSLVREYVDKVASPANAEGHTVGTGGSDKPSMNAKSIVAGKNDMGGTAGLVKGGAEQAPEGKATPQPNNQYAKNKGNLPHAGNFENVPGAKTKGYVNKMGAKPAEGSTTDGSVPVQKHSPVAR